jgi:tetratricopeptide (TPR) repeat protein
VAFGGIFYQHGDYLKSAKLFEYTVDAYEEMLGPGHIKTLGTVGSLALLYSDQGQERYPEAERLYKRALAGQEKVLGPDHSDTLITVNNLANLYYKQGRHPEAHALRTKFNLNST